MFTRSDLSRKYNVTVVTIDRWRAAGILPAPLVLGKKTVRWRETDIARYDRWLLDQSEAQLAGLDPLQIPPPDYSLPISNDPSALTREFLASHHDPESQLLSETDQLQAHLDQLCKNAAIIASRSLPGQVSESTVENLKKHFSDSAKQALLADLPAKNAERLEEILA